MPNNFRVQNKFIRILLQYRTNHRTDGPEGGGSMFGMPEGCGGGVGVGFVFSGPFWATLIYKVFRSGQPLPVPEIIDKRPERRGCRCSMCYGGVVDKQIA